LVVLVVVFLAASAVSVASAVPALVVVTPQGSINLNQFCGE
jgi:hypothetical protein